MNVFCCYVKYKLFRKFKVEIDAFVSKKKKLVHFAFYKPLISYPFCDEIIDFVASRWGERRNFLAFHGMIYPRLDHKMKWKSYIFLRGG